LALHLSLFLSSPSAPRHLPSFPTRRSSDLQQQLIQGPDVALLWRAGRDQRLRPVEELGAGQDTGEDLLLTLPRVLQPGAVAGLRSEEHTSELQSLTNLVCRLLLETKKSNNP